MSTSLRLCLFFEAVDKITFTKASGSELEMCKYHNYSQYSPRVLNRTSMKKYQHYMPDSQNIRKQ